ncbi:hypothetical protein MLD38_002972 [Melastoma candidum]|uniref:Uncharacterized protein n=1 Tax=Melastoma candidum TaxID=119954 RepID=A0ACB9S322_9MYRT|nr:hypothetical protein MLD38_002972 [Melastoma candidum]
MIMSKYPSIKGVILDLPHVSSMLEEICLRAFLKEMQSFMKWICHDWSNGHCLKILKNCYEALSDDGKVIVVESLLPGLPDSTVAVKRVYHVDCIMMTFNPGGKERTAEAEGAGFQGFRVVCCMIGIYTM